MTENLPTQREVFWDLARERDELRAEVERIKATAGEQLAVSRQLLAEIRQMRAALRWYANAESDGGQRAREALGVG
jgi:hypothetical protein